MGCVVFLFTAIIAASEATLLYCPSSDGSGSMTDLQQATVLPYCVIDNCTIMRIDTAEKLDIVYITNSIIVISPTDSQTFSVIAKDDNELPCFISTINYHKMKLIGPMIVSTLIITVSS